MKNSLYYFWNAGKVGNFGSFQTKIFEAYRIADCGNMEILQNAFPRWFVYDCSNIYS